MLNHTISSSVSRGFESLKDSFASFQQPEDSISIYDENAYHGLISKLVQAKRKGQNFTVVAHGGSTTAGGAGVLKEDRYYSRFADFLNLLLSRSDVSEGAHQPVKSIGQGHGSRNSLHSAILFDNFVPPDTDLLLWEFSINDSGQRKLPERVRLKLSKMNLIAWLHEVEKMERPPKVLLIYYCDLKYDDNKGISFASHDIARQFDFVVGHVNVGKYLDELKLPSCETYLTCPFLADPIHASQIGHLATAFLLLNLLDPNRLTRTSVKQETFMNETKYEWSCGVETEEKQILKDVITNSSTGWKSPLGQWTLDLPVLDSVTPRRLIFLQTDYQIENVGKASPIRQDSKHITSLNYCGATESESSSLITAREPMRDIRVMLMVLGQHLKKKKKNTHTSHR